MNSLEKFGVWPLAMLMAAGLFGGCRKAPPKTTATSSAAYSVNYDVTKGRELFVQNCAACHGPTGEGNGVNAESLTPKPADLTSKVRLGRRSAADVAAVIKNGGPALQLSEMMPGFASTLDETQVQCLVAYVRTLSQSDAAAKP